MRPLVSLALPPPDDAQAFEDLCLDLWRRLWRDPNARKNGRSGQAQAGVDVFGRPDGGDGYAGVQCKVRKPPGRLSRGEIEEEVRKARSFKPPLRELILATTASRDGLAQEAEREINLAQLRDGSFSVSLVFWEDILSHLALHPDLVTRHFGRFFSPTAVLARRRLAALAVGLGLAALALGIGLGWLRDRRDAAVLRKNHDALDLQADGRIEEARRTFQAALALDPGNAVVHGNLCTLEADEGRAADALEHCRAAARAAPGVALHHYNLGALLAGMDRGEEALVSLGRATRLQPKYAAAWNEMGDVYLRLDRPAEARAAFASASAADGRLAPAHKNLGRMALEAGELAEAARQLETALALYRPAERLGTVEALYWLALTHSRSGDAAASCRRLRELRRLDGAGVSPWAPAAASLARKIHCEAAP